MRKHIQLPTIKHVRVKNFSVFNNGDEMDWAITPGLNYVLGGNGLGKTTLINLIQYALTGNRDILKYLISIHVAGLEDPLTHSSTHKLDKMGTPQIVVSCSFGESEVEVTRLINQTASVSVFTANIDGNSVNFDKINATLKFNDIILQCTGLKSIAEFDFLFDKLLFRKEESNALAWDPDEQMQVLLLLINPVGYHAEYERLREIYDKAYTRHKHLVDGRSKVRNQIRKLDTDIRKLDSSTNLQDDTQVRYESEVSSLQDRRRATMQGLEELITELSVQQAVLDDLTQQEDKILIELDEMENESANIELLIHRQIYGQNLNHMSILEKLLTHQRCSYCDQYVSDEKLSPILERLQTSHCVFCEQDLPDSMKQHEPDHANVLTFTSDYVEKLEDLEKKRIEVRNQITSVNQRLRSLNKEVTDMRSQLNTIETRMMAIESEMNRKNYEGERESYNSARSILDLRRDIEGYRYSERTFSQDIPEASKEMDTAEAEWNDFTKSHTDRIEKYQAQVSEAFAEYARSMLGLNSKLEKSTQKTAKNKRYFYDIYLPRIKGVLRETPDELSKSQAILIDYSFRMALIDLYYELTDCEATLIFETSEGVLDLSYVKRYGNVLSDFAQSHNLVLVSNVSRLDFLESVYHQIDRQERSRRTLNFFEIGRLSDVQEDGKVGYDDIWFTIFGKHIRW